MKGKIEQLVDITKIWIYSMKYVSCIHIHLFCWIQKMCIMSIKCRWHSTPFLIGRAYISFIIAVVTDDPFINILRFISQLTNNYDTD